MMKLNIGVFVFFVLTGCVKTNTQVPDLSQYPMPELEVKHTVMVSNSAPEEDEIRIGRIRAWRVYGDLYKFTETAVGVARNILERKDITIQNGAEKELEFSVYNAKSEMGEGGFSETISLRVRTGDGLTKECSNTQYHGVLFTASRAIERALAQCVLKMLSNGEIVSYLENITEEYYSPQQSVDSFDNGEDEYYSPADQQKPKDLDMQKNKVDSIENADEYYSSDD